MVGEPKTFATKQDVLNGLVAFPDVTRDALRRLLDDRYRIVSSEVLPEGDGGQHGPPLLRVRDGGSEMDAEGNVIRRHLFQEVWQEDPNATLFRLGFTVEEAEGLLNR